MNKRPVTVTIMGWLLIAVGVAGSAFHLNELKQNAFRAENAWIFVVESVVIICGAFVLRGNNWARWLTLTWMASHVVISFWDSWQKVLAHVVFLVLMTYIFFRPEARAYFRQSETT